jgi:hypothetical protein
MRAEPVEARPEAQSPSEAPPRGPFGDARWCSVRTNCPQSARYIKLHLPRYIEMHAVATPLHTASRPEDSHTMCPRSVA